jgi:hypothetical protein
MESQMTCVVMPEQLEFEWRGAHLAIAMGISVIDISEAERNKLLALAEGHFLDVKDLRVSPFKLTRTIFTLSNAEGGEV